MRNIYGRNVGIFGFCTNLFLSLIKFVIGIFSNSISIIIDASNNLMDSVTSLITIIGFNLSNKRPDKTHPYGFARYEYICGFTISLFMFIVGIFFLKESIIKIIKPKDLNINIYTYIILFIAIILKIILGRVYLYYSKKINSNALKTNYIDTRNDVISTIGILISIIIMNIFNINIDGYIGLLISIFVIYSSINTINEMLKPIVGIIPSKEKVKEIKNKLLNYPYVLGIHDLVIHNYGVNNDFITVHIEMDSKLSMLEAHDLIDNIENDFKTLGYNLTMHIDPIIIGNKNIDKLKNKVIKLLNNYDKDLSIHDFRVIEGVTTKILFDCVIPFEKRYNEKDIINYLENNMKDIEFNIEIDRPFC